MLLRPILSPNDGSRLRRARLIAASVVAHLAVLALVLGITVPLTPSVPNEAAIVELVQPSADPPPERPPEPVPETPEVAPAPPTPAPIPAPTVAPIISAPPPKPPPPRPVLPKPVVAHPPVAPSVPPPVVAEAPTAAPSAPMPAPVPAPKVSASWRQALGAWIGANRVYPEQARRDGVQGDVTLRFTVDRLGHVHDVTLVRSAGSAMLDQGAMAMLQGGNLPAFPDDMTQDSATVTVQIHYALRN